MADHSECGPVLQHRERADGHSEVVCRICELSAEVDRLKSVDIENHRRAPDYPTPALKSVECRSCGGTGDNLVHGTECSDSTCTATTALVVGDAEDAKRFKLYQLACRMMTDEDLENEGKLLVALGMRATILDRSQLCATCCKLGGDDDERR